MPASPASTVICSTPAIFFRLSVSSACPETGTGFGKDHEQDQSFYSVLCASNRTRGASGRGNNTVRRYLRAKVPETGVIMAPMTLASTYPNAGCGIADAALVSVHPGLLRFA